MMRPEYDMLIQQSICWDHKYQYQIRFHCPEASCLHNESKLFNICSWSRGRTFHLVLSWSRMMNRKCVWTRGGHVASVSWRHRQEADQSLSWLIERVSCIQWSSMLQCCMQVLITGHGSESIIPETWDTLCGLHTWTSVINTQHISNVHNSNRFITIYALQASVKSFKVYFWNLSLSLYEVSIAHCSGGDTRLWVREDIYIVTTDDNWPDTHVTTSGQWPESYDLSWSVSDLGWPHSIIDNIDNMEHYKSCKYSVSI